MRRIEESDWLKSLTETRIKHEQKINALFEKLEMSKTVSYLSLGSFLILHTTKFNVRRTLNMAFFFKR